MSDQKPIRILYIEDDRELANLVEKQLRREGFSVDIAYDGEEGLAKYFSGSYDVLLLDQVMPVYNGLEVIRILDSRGPLPPTVMITGMGNESLAVEAMKMGATDYIVKDAGCGFLELFPAVIEQAIFTTRLAEQKMRAVEKLRTSEKKYRMLFELASDAFLVAFPPDDTIIDSNKAATTMLGYSKEEFRTLTIWEVFAPEVIEKARIEWKTQLKDSNYFSLESIWLRKDGSQLPVAMSGVLFEFEGIPQIQFIAHYITERKQEEEKKDNHSRGCHRHPL